MSRRPTRRSPLGEDASELRVSGIRMAWDPRHGTCTFAGLPVAMMWVDTTLAGLMAGVQAMVGTDRFGLALQAEGRKSVETDWQVIAAEKDFRQGFQAIATIAAVAGWGEWTLTHCDEEAQELRFRARGSWEGRYQLALGVCWGSGMLAGKFAGYGSHLFGVNCWAEQTAFSAQGHAADEFIVRPSPRSIEKEIEGLLATDEATRADMAVALRRLESEIAERRRAEEALRESQALYTDLVNSQSAGIYRIRVLSADGWRSPDQPPYVYEFVSDRYCALFGVDREELRRDPGVTLRQIHPEDREDFAQRNEEAARTLEPFLWQGRMTIRDQVRWIRFESCSRCLENGDVLWTGVAMDISEAKFLEQRLHQAEKMDAIGQLAGGIAHDFNNVLGGIAGYAELLQRRLTEPHLRRYADDIVKTALRAADLTTQLLAFARKGKYVAVPVNLHDVIHDVVGLLSHSVDRRIEIRQHLDANPAWTRGDRTQLQSALLNLAVNARDAMPEGGELTFATSLATLDERSQLPELKPGRYLLVCVTDTGTGMSAEVQQRLFEPFFTTKEQGKGTGLGLAAAYGAVHNHHGAISVYSEPGRGSTFKIYLPLATTPGTTVEAAPAEPPAMLRGARILVVDDEASIRETTAEMLRDLGCTVTTCQDGDEAVRYYAVHWQEIDLVILDMVMPRRSGRDAFLAMRRENPRIRALLASGHSINGEAQRILEEGVLGFLQKPFETNALARMAAEATHRTASPVSADLQTPSGIVSALRAHSA